MGLEIKVWLWTVDCFPDVLFFVCFFMVNLCNGTLSLSVSVNTCVSCSLFRNTVLESSFSELGYKAPNARKTGTTIAGMVYKVRNYSVFTRDHKGVIYFSSNLSVSCLVPQDGVILGADTRATDDMVVADKNCMKIHYIAPKI